MGTTMWVELLVGAAFGFLGGLMTAWRIAAKGAAQAWLEDLRDLVQVRKTERRKKQAIRHAKLDQQLEAEAAKAHQQLTADTTAKEAERKRIRRAHSELKKALPFANEAVRTYTNQTWVESLAFVSQTYPNDAKTASEVVAEREKFERHRAAIEQLRRHVETLAGLGVDLAHPVHDWSAVLSMDLRKLAEKIDKATKEHALKL
ncbi:hypothetical protein ACFYR2_27695 [Streptomyces microflavus]|uniref:hypothetical protein n=1 Tax=Streptomyces microflavus TaxID=1919 RepID=UPI003678659A